MIYKIFSVWDSKIEAYMQPFFSPTIGSGIRAFLDASQEPNSMLFKHPSDFHLHHIGQFDDGNGALEDMNPHAIGTAEDFQEAAQ